MAYIISIHFFTLIDKKIHKSYFPFHFLKYIPRDGIIDYIKQNMLILFFFLSFFLNNKTILYCGKIEETGKPLDHSGMT